MILHAVSILPWLFTYLPLQVDPEACRVSFRYITLCYGQTIGNDRRRNSMRKDVALELVSLDCVMKSPEERTFSSSNNEMEEKTQLEWPLRTRC